MSSQGEEWDVYMDTEPPEEDAPPPASSAASEPDKAVQRTPLANLLLSERTLQVLAQQGVRTLGQLTRLHSSQLQSVPGFGAKARQEVEEALDYFGLQLRPEPQQKPISRTACSQHRTPDRKRPVARQLLLPEMEGLPRVCVGCRQALLPPDSAERYCSRACHQASRAKLSPLAASKTVSAPSEQLALEV